VHGEVTDAEIRAARATTPGRDSDGCDSDLLSRICTTHGADDVSRAAAPSRGWTMSWIDCRRRPNTVTELGAEIRAG